MLVKIYWTLCGVVTAAALLLVAAGAFTNMAGVVFGFIAFGLTFMGMIAVLPITVSHPAAAKPAQARQPVTEKETIAVPAEPFRVLKSA